jgi:hypothetical protein
MELYKEDIRNTNHAASSGAVDGGGKTGGGKVIRSC